MLIGVNYFIILIYPTVELHSIIEASMFINNLLAFTSQRNNAVKLPRLGLN